MKLVEVLSQVIRLRKQISCLRSWKRTITKHPFKDPLEEDKVESRNWIEYRP